MKPSAYDQALRLLTRRDHSVMELRRKLLQRDYREPEISEALDRLRELKYLDDSRTAQIWAQQEANRPGQGRRKALNRMVEHGLSFALAGAALDDAWDDTFERQQARHVVDKWKRSLENQDRPSRKERARLARQLAARGFEPDLVNETLRRLDTGTESGDFV